MITNPGTARFFLAQVSSCQGKTRAARHRADTSHALKFVWVTGKYIEARHCGHELGKAFFFMVLWEVCALKKMASVTKQEPVNCITLSLIMGQFRSVTTANRNFCFAPGLLGNPTFM